MRSRAWRPALATVTAGALAVSMLFALSAYGKTIAHSGGLSDNAAAEVTFKVNKGKELRKVKDFRVANVELDCGRDGTRQDTLTFGSAPLSGKNLKKKGTFSFDGNTSTESFRVSGVVKKKGKKASGELRYISTIRGPEGTMRCEVSGSFTTSK